MSNAKQGGDLVIVGADLYLGGCWQRGSIVVRDGIIAEVIPAADIAELSVPEGCAVIDAAGASVLPGFQDAHVHPAHGGAALLGVDLAVAHDIDSYLQLIVEYAAAHPEAEVLCGSGWYGDLFEHGMPTADILDAIVPDRPVLIGGHDGHSLWVNSAALERAGISAQTPDPADGRVVRDASGKPTGTLLDGAMNLVRHLRPAETQESLIDSLLAAQTYLHSYGVTAWADAMVGDSELGGDPFDAYLALACSGQLTARVLLGLWWDRTRGLEQIDEFERRRSVAAEHPNLAATTVKIMQDGMLENHTGAMVCPYADAHGGNAASFIDPVELTRIAVELDRRGFDIHFHGCGDRAVRECLDAVAEIRRQGGGIGRRHQIAHVDVVHPDDLPRFAELGVIANVQMLWARRDKEMLERKLPQLGVDREHWQFPFASLQRAGARLAAGSDWPVSHPNPLWAIHTGMYRTAPTDDVHAIGAEALTHPLERQEGLELTAALDAYTSGAAWANRLERDSGVIAVGMRADLVVLDAALATAPDLSRVQVVTTLVAGETVYRRESSSSG